MSDDGRQLLAFVKDTRTLCQQVADMMGVVDDRLFQDGWELATSQNIAFANGSTSLAHPELWFPYEVFRFYQKAAQPSRLAFVSLLLDDDREEVYKLSEPLATAGWFDFRLGVNAPVVVSGSWWWSRFHGYMPGRKDDGSIHTVAPAQEWPAEVAKRPDHYPFERASTFGVPLAELTTAEILHARIISPLIANISPEMT